MTIEKIMEVQKVKAKGVQKLGVVIPSKYRILQITLEQATEIAKAYFSNVILPKYPAEEYEYTELKFGALTPMTYNFFIYSEKSFRKGRAPSGMYISIDTFDDHCWDLEEQSNYWSYIEGQERKYGVYPWDH